MRPVSAFLALPLLAALTATPAIARDKADKPADPDKKVCRTLEQTGSIFTKRICHTAEEWKTIDADDARSAQSLSDTPNRGADGSPRL